MNAPVVTVFATELPEMEPIKPDATTAVIAGPLFRLPVSPKARSMKNLPTPVLSRMEPKSMNMNTKVAETPRGIPIIPSRPMYICAIILWKEKPLCANSPGMLGPKYA